MGSSDTPLPGLEQALHVARASDPQPWVRARVRVALPAGVTFPGARLDVAADDAVADAVVWLLGVAARLGVDASAVSLDTPLDEHHDRRLRAAGQGPQGLSLGLEVHPVLPAAEGTSGLRDGLPSGLLADLRLAAPGRALAWRLAPAGEAVDLVRGAAKASRRFPAADSGDLASHRIAGAPVATPALLAHARELVHEHLHGHTLELHRLRRAGLEASLDRRHPLWARVVLPPVTDAGHAPVGQVDHESVRALLTPLPRPLRVLLVRAPQPTAFDALFPPLALAQLAGAARAVGAEVTLLDLAPPFVGDATGGQPLGLEARDPAAARALLADALRPAGGGFDLVGLSLTWPLPTRFVEEVLLRELRDRGDLLVAGGPGAARLPEGSAAARALDAVVLGEGEVPLLALLQARAAGRGTADVPGLWRTDRPCASATLPLLPDLDALPGPDFTGLDLAPYEPHTPWLQRPFLPLLFLRGCPHRCTFCADESGRRVRAREPAQVVADLTRLVTQHGVRDFYFLNNLINLQPAWLTRLLDGLDAADLGLRFVDCARVNGLDGPLAERLAAAGCVQLTFGVDAGSDRLLGLTRKGFTLEQASQAIRATSRAGIAAVVNLIVGLPHETDEDFEGMRRFVERTRPYVARYLAMPFNYTLGSPLANTPAAFGLRRRGDTFDGVPDGPDWAAFTATRDRRYRILLGDLGQQPPLRTAATGT